MTETPPKSAGWVTPQSDNALAFVEQLEDYAHALKRELRAYGDPNTVGRDAQRISAFLSDVHRCELQVASALSIAWPPTAT